MLCSFDVGHHPMFGLALAISQIPTALKRKDPE